MHEHANLALKLCPFWPTFVPARWLLFVDGTGGSTTVSDPIPAWACVLLAENEHGEVCFYGAMAGETITNPHNAWWMGVQTATSGSSELQGMQYALLWLLQQPQYYGMIATIYYDSDYAAGTIMGTYKANTHAKMVAVTAAVADIVRTKYDLRAEHVKSH